MSNEVKPIESAPEFMDVPCKKINELAKALKPMMNLKAGKNLVITVSDSDILFEYNPPKPGDGSTQRLPLDLYIDDTTGSLNMVYGTVQGEVPPGVQGGSSPVDYPLADNIYWIEVTINGDGVYVSNLIGYGATLPADTTTLKYLQLGEMQTIPPDAS